MRSAGAVRLCVTLWVPNFRLFVNNCGMSRTRKKQRRRKLSVKGRKTLSMEEKSPAMPLVVFLKYSVNLLW